MSIFTIYINVNSDILADHIDVTTEGHEWCKYCQSTLMWPVTYMTGHFHWPECPGQEWPTCWRRGWPREERWAVETQLLGRWWTPGQLLQITRRLI